MRNNKASIAAIIIAAISGFTTLGKAWIDSKSTFNLQTVVAEEVVRNQERWRAVESLIESQAASSKDITALREAVAGLKTSIRFLSGNYRKAARDSIDDVVIPQPEESPTEKVKAAAERLIGSERPAPAQVQQVRGKLFD